MKKMREVFKKFNQDSSLFVLLGLVFIASRFLMLLMGFKFDIRFLNIAWQTVDTWLLRTDLLRSIWYLHSQPPLFNLFIGTILKAFPVHSSVVFEMIYHFLGLVLTLSLYGIIKNISTNRWLAFIIALIFVISPAVLMFENFFFYDFPVMVILLIIALFFQKFVETNKTSYLLSFFFTAALLVLTRRVFHFIWFLVLTFVLLYFYRANWKRIFFASLVPLLLIVFWCGKNYYYFGKFDTSSWTGMGFFKTATYALGDTERKKMFDEGIVSKNIFYGSDPFQIPVVTSTVPGFSQKLLSIPVLGSYTKKEGGLNFNHPSYIILSRQLMEEFLSIMKRRPAVYLKGTLVTSIIFFSPASGYFAASENNNAVDLNYPLVKKLDILFNKIVYGQPLAWGGERLQDYLANLLHIKKTQAWRLLSPGIFLVAVYLISILYGLRIMFQKNASSIYGNAVYLMVVFLVINILYVSAVGILAEAGENQRHRFMIEPLNWILFALFIQNVFLKKKSK
jgi:hypothetical protein